jgi:hypothetical protein
MFIPSSAIDTANKYGGTDMVPLLASALVGAGSNLLGNLLGGIGSAKATKNEQAWQEKMANQQRQWKLSDAAAIKPQVPYYQSKNMPGMDYLMSKAVMGNLGERLGGLADKWGLNINDITSTLGLNQKFSETDTAKQYYPQTAPQYTSLGQSMLGQKYGMGNSVYPQYMRRNQERM